MFKTNMNPIQQYIQDHQLNAMRLGGKKTGAERSGERAIAVFNPFTEEQIGSVPKATPEEVRHTFKAAHAFNPQLSRFERAAILNRASVLISQRLDEVANLITAESGLCLKDSMYEAGRVADVLLFGANEVLKDDGQIFSCDLTHHGKKRRVYTQRSPLLGVISAITPFNHPMNQVAHKVVPSIATNNRMVLKPSEKVPFSAILFADILYEAGLPPEMLSIITGDPREIADELITNEHVDLVTFTGGVGIGKYIASKAGYRRMVLELGGNDPIIVMEDADLDEASTLAVQGSYKNSGQRCTAVKRLLVHEAVADRFVEQVVEKTRAWKYGDPLDKSNDMGTVIDEAAAMLFESRVNEAVAQGAKLLVGNQRSGALYSPTVLDRVNPQMTVAMLETFGPVSPIIRFKNIDEAIAISNGTAYGLSSAVCTNRLDYITRFVSELQVGTVNVREVPGYRLELTPFGGIKDSGLGYKEGVQEAIKSFTNLKTYSLPWV
jgi:putative phosphonoacetaldehyde dehydrogenase